jgi:hypothetical protein
MGIVSAEDRSVLHGSVLRRGAEDQDGWALGCPGVAWSLIGWLSAALGAKRHCFRGERTLHWGGWAEAAAGASGTVQSRDDGGESLRREVAGRGNAER